MERNKEEKISRNISLKGMQYDFSEFNYTYDFTYPFHLKDPSIEGDNILNIDRKEAMKKQLIWEFELSINTALYGDPSGILIKDEAIFDQIHKNSLIPISEKFEDLLLQSIKKNGPSWTMKSVFSDSGNSYNFYSPEYNIGNNIIIQFADDQNGICARINSQIKWNMSISPFRKKLRTIRKELKSVENYLIEIKRKQVNNQTELLLNSLSDLFKTQDGI